MNNITLRIKPKKCKGIGRARTQLGCGKMELYRKYGLCPSCLSNFYLNTNEGQQIMQSKIIKAKKDIKIKLKRKQKIEWDYRKCQLEKDAHGVGYFQQKLQVEINKLVRIIDNGSPCISSNKLFTDNEKYDAGHCYPVSSNSNIRFNLLNIHAQSVYDNQHLGGNQAPYIININQLFGSDYLEWLNKSKYEMDLQLSKDDLVEARKAVMSFCKELTKSKKHNFNTLQRIKARRRYMKLLFDIDVPVFKIELT